MLSGLPFANGRCPVAALAAAIISKTRDAAVRFRTLVRTRTSVNRTPGPVQNSALGPNRTQSPVPGSGVGNLVNLSGPVRTSELQVSTERASWLLRVAQAGHLVFMHIASNADSKFKTPQRTSPHDMALYARLLSPPSTCLVRTHAPLAEIVADLRTPHPLQRTQLSAPQPTHPPFPHLYAHPPRLSPHPYSCLAPLLRCSPTHTLPHPRAHRHRSSKSRCTHGEPRSNSASRRDAHDLDVPIRARPCASLGALPAFSTDFLSVAPLLTRLTTLANAPLFAHRESQSRDGSGLR